MKLSTVQVAEKLGITRDRAQYLIQQGKLTDVAAVKEGQKRHCFLVESSQVGEYLKEFGRGNTRPRRVSTNGNGHALVETSTGPGALSRIEAKLDALTASVAALLKAWS
jgi:hypothetical protein